MDNEVMTGSQGGLSSPNKRTFAEKLYAATNEDKEVNPIYVNAIGANLSRLKAGLDKSSANYDLYTDGVFDCWYISDNGHKEWFILQLECKTDVDLNDSKQLANVVIQVCYYLKRFEKESYQLPKVIVIGTKLNCMAIPAIYLYNNYVKNRNYPEEDPETGKRISASTAPFHPLYQPLRGQIAEDPNLSVSISKVVGVTEKSAARELCIDILKIAKDLGLKEEITEATVSRAFEHFNEKVLAKKSRDKLSSRQKAEVFMTLFLTPEKVRFEQNVLGSNDYTTMYIGDQIIDVERGTFNKFANSFAVKKYTIEEQKKITAITDRLIENLDRRKKGDFYTPDIWVNEAHKLITKHLGNDWRNNYIVWDCAWGTGNLTRDYRFDDLYCSTIQDEDLKIGEKYNPFSIKFLYDFLNDDILQIEKAKSLLWKPFVGTVAYHNKKVEPHVNFREILDLYENAIENGITTDEKCKAAYKEAIDELKHTLLHYRTYDQEEGISFIDKLIDTDEENRKDLVFIINPPYGTSKNNSTKIENNSKSGIAETSVRGLMNDLNLGMAQRQLYAQFLFRCQYIMEIFGVKTYIGSFSQSDFLTTVSYGKFRDYFYNKCKFLDGFQFSGGYFDSVSDYVGLTFTLWETGKVTELPIKIDIVDTEINMSGDIGLKQIETRELAPVDNLMNVNIRNRIKVLKKKQKTKTVIALKSGLNIKVESPTATCAETAIGGFQCNSNDVNQNAQRVCLLSSQFYGAANMEILPETFDDAVTLFTARRLIKPNWINWKDEYMEPDKASEKYKQFVDDSLVYSLFESKSQQTAMRNISINEKNFNIYNEFFWIDRQSIYDWALKCNNQAVIDDVVAHAKSERFMYKRLQKAKLSEDAKLILDYATALLKDTMQYREEYDRGHMNSYIYTWDAGWYQLKEMIKDKRSEEYKVFVELYRQFEDRMRPLVYELGFLYK